MISSATHFRKMWLLVWEKGPLLDDSLAITINSLQVKEMILSIF